MIIKILGAESLGVRGLACSVELKDRKIIIDPGIALGWSRYSLLPHPFQVATGAGIRDRIIKEVGDASDVVITHFDGDHCPLLNPNPYQLGINEVKDSLCKCRIWSKETADSSFTQLRRSKELAFALNKDLIDAQGMKEGPLEFSRPVPHGAPAGKVRDVMMVRIEEQKNVFVHASDIQLVDSETIDKIISWRPDIVLASGPPLYLYGDVSFERQRLNAWENALRLCENVGTLVVDHHLLRSAEGVSWLAKLKDACRNQVLSAADFMERAPLYLESWRKELYQWLPVDDDWHDAYAKGRVGFDQYRTRGWDELIKNGKIRPCKWYYACPVREYALSGKLERYWIENYCLVRNKGCIRYQLEESGRYHPDNMLPDGEIREDL